MGPGGEERSDRGVNCFYHFSPEKEVNNKRKVLFLSYGCSLFNPPILASCFMDLPPWNFKDTFCSLDRVCLCVFSKG